jgi:hypothetical protein
VFVSVDQEIRISYLNTHLSDGAPSLLSKPKPPSPLFSLSPSLSALFIEVDPLTTKAKGQSANSDRKLEGYIGERLPGAAQFDLSLNEEAYLSAQATDSAVCGGQECTGCGISHSNSCTALILYSIVICSLQIFLWLLLYLCPFRTSCIAESLSRHGEIRIDVASSGYHGESRKVHESIART